MKHLLSGKKKKRAESLSNVLFWYLDDQIIVKHKPLNLQQIGTVSINTELNEDISYGANYLCI